MGKIKKIKRNVKERRGIVGCSDIGAILGVSKRETPYDVYLTFCGEEKVFTEAEQERMEMGIALEDFIAERATLKYGYKLRKSCMAWVCPEEEHLICHPDRIVTGKIDGKTVAVEIKSSSAYDNSWGEDGTDEVPYHYLCQCLGYFICGVCDEVHLIRFANNKLSRYIIQRNEELESAILSKVKEFVAFALEGIAPAAVSYQEAVKKYNEVIDNEVYADTIIEAVSREYDKTRQQIRELEADNDERKAQMIEYMQGRSRLVDREGNVLRRYSVSVSKRFDSKKFKEECPDEYEKYIKESTSYRFV